MAVPFKIKPGTKLAALPVEQRIFLRLVTVKSRQNQIASLKTIATEVGCTFFETMKVVEAFQTAGVISNIQPIDVSDFRFDMDAEVKKVLLQHAANYSKHLKAKALRLDRRAAAGVPPPTPPPAHLPSITKEQREPWMEKAKVLAAKINRPLVDTKIANCIVRVGVENVERLIDEAIPKATPEFSARRIFFASYTVLRDQLIPAK
jgi:hypothetical protein